MRNVCDDSEIDRPACRRHSGLEAWIGVAREDITPPVGIYARNWGAAKHDIANGIHRPLTLTALSIAADARSKPMILLDADLGWWKTPQVFQRFQAQLLEASGLKATNLIFALSHTHAGPPLMEPDNSLAGYELIGPWMESVIAQSKSAMSRARQSACQSILEWHTGRCSLAAYRDLPEPTSSSVRTQRIICGFNPAGQADDTLLIGRVTDSQGRIAATLANYACHPTTLAWDNTSISPDYLGAFRETIEKTTGAPALFLQGASGELSPREQYVGNPDVADRHGRQLAHAALATLYDMETAGNEFAYEGVVESGAPLAVWKHRSRAVPRSIQGLVRYVELPIKDWPSADQLEQERIRCTDRALEERLRRKRDIRRALGDGATFNLPVWVWRLGDAVLVGCCGEAYSILQTELRRRFAPRAVVCMNLINGSIGYLPPEPLYDLDLYQVWQTPFDRGSLERVIAAMSDAIEQVLDEQRTEHRV